jgi:putative transcriptional regulator
MNNELKLFRAKHDLTQAELAERVGVSRQTITAIETGKYNPSLELALKLAECFGCRVEDLFSPDHSPADVNPVPSVDHDLDVG